MCLQSCIAAGYTVCGSVTFEGSTGMCRFYTDRLEEYGAHATAVVTAPGGLGVVSASYCQPPGALAVFPNNDNTLFGAAPCPDSAETKMVASHVRSQSAVSRAQAAT